MSPLGFLLIVIAMAFLWLALIRPQKRQRETQARMWETLEVGDEVVTAGGIYGEITDFAGEDVLVRITPEVEVRVARRAIAAVTTPPDEAEEPEQPDESDEETAAAGAESYPEDSR